MTKQLDPLKAARPGIIVEAMGFCRHAHEVTVRNDYAWSLAQALGDAYVIELPSATTIYEAMATDCVMLAGCRVKRRAA